MVCAKALVFVLLFAVSWAQSEVSSNSLEDENNSVRSTIEGKIIIDQLFVRSNWQAKSRIHVNGGEYLGFIKEDGTFLIHNVPPGSYVLEVISSELMYEPVRVEINSKGKFRARKVNHIQTSQVMQLPYPLRLKPIGPIKYFQLREQWMITDILFNPMILMMVLPLLLIMVLPKMISDPESKKELEQMSNMKFEMPEVSDMFTNYLAGSANPPAQTSKKISKSKKRQ